MNAVCVITSHVDGSGALQFLSDQHVFKEQKGDGEVSETKTLNTNSVSSVAVLASFKVLEK